MTEGSSSPLPLDRAPGRIEGMFDAIAGRYDLLNRVLSAGLDRGWRRRAVRSLELPGGARALDLCTGTADLALALARTGSGTTVVGVDFAAEMLRHGQEKVRRAGRGDRVTLLRGDALRVPLGDASVDAVTVGFGIRNVADVERALTEIVRVLRPGGRLAILEFGYPRAARLRAVYSWYFTSILPRIGGLVSRHGSAYRYLPESVGTFPEPSAFRAALEAAGLEHARATPLTWGIVSLYTARKPRPGTTGRDMGTAAAIIG